MLSETCLFCGNTFKVPDEYQGKKIKCPKCKELLGISVRKREAAPAAVPAPSDVDIPPTEAPREPSAKTLLRPVATAQDAGVGLRFEGEELVFETKPSMAALVLRMVMVVVLMVGIVIYANVSALPMTFKIVGSVACCLLAGALSVDIWLAWANTVYMLTSSRVVSQTGVARMRVRSCPLERVGAVILKVGLVQRLLGTGSIHIGTGNAFGWVTWRDVEDPQGVANLVAQHVDHRYTFLAETEGSLRSRAGH